MTIDATTCRSCGACCVAPADDPTYVSVDRKDLARLPKSFVRLHVVKGAISTSTREYKSGPLDGADVCTCVALKGNVGSRVSCSVYDSRPEVCRVFTPGKPACLESRRQVFDLA